MILDLDGLGGVVQQVALLGLDLLNHIAARFQVRDGDITVFISAELAIGRTDYGPVRGGHFESHLAERFLGYAVHLLDDQSTQRLIGDGDFLAAAALHLDGLGSTVKQIARCGLSFRNGVAAGGNVAQLDLAVGIGGISACGILAAVAPGDLELDTGQGLAGHAVHLGNEETALESIAEFEGDGLSRLDRGGLGSIVQLIAGLSSGFLDH